MNETATFEILKHMGTLNTYKDGWNLELNIVSWYGKPPKYDIRSWNPEHNKMTRGIALTKQEAESLAEILRGDFEE